MTEQINGTPETPEQVQQRFIRTVQLYGQALLQSMSNERGEVNINPADILVQLRLAEYRFDVLMEVLAEGGFPANVIFERFITRLETETAELRKPRIALALGRTQ